MSGECAWPAQNSAPPLTSVLCVATQGIARLRTRPASHPATQPATQPPSHIPTDIPVYWERFHRSKKQNHFLCQYVENKSNLLFSIQ